MPKPKFNDTMRLDWLEESRRAHLIYADYRSGFYKIMSETGTFEEEYQPTLRAAIDAAISRESQNAKTKTAV